MVLFRRAVKALLVVLVIFCAASWGMGCGEQTARATPTQATGSFVDGLNSFDFRQACNAIAPNTFPSQYVCRAYFTNATAVTGWNKWTVVPHSVRVWTEKYRGRAVTLAAVDVVGEDSRYVAQLRLTGDGWRLYALVPAKGSA